MTGQTDSKPGQIEREPQTDLEWAEYYQAHKEETESDDWEMVPSPIKRRPGRPSMGFASRITVRFTPSETDIIRRASSAQGGIGYSEVVRRAVLALEKDYPAASGKQNGAR